MNEYHVESGRPSGSSMKPKLIVFNDNTATHIGKSSLQPRSFMVCYISMYYVCIFNLIFCSRQRSQSFLRKPLNGLLKNLILRARITSSRSLCS